MARTAMETLLAAMVLSAVFLGGLVLCFAEHEEGGMCGISVKRINSYLKKADSHINVARSVLMDEGLGGQWLWLMLMESGGDISAKSDRGAAGLWQLTGATARHYGCQDRTDTAESTAAAARYIRKLLDDFGGDEWKAIVGYNMGGSNYRRAGEATPEAKRLADTVTCLMRQEIPGRK